MYRARYRRILFFFAKTIFSLAWWDVLLPRLGLRRAATANRAERLHRIAVEFRLMAIQMGGVMIKVGQFLSARLDVLPKEITDELAGLQDEARPESFADIRRAAEREFDLPLTEKFSEFNEQPVASASIGQVHCATLRQPAGEALLPEVIVKVQRPQIEAIVDVDLSALRRVGGWLQRYPPIRRRADVPALLDEFTRSLHEEMDYLAEGKNAETFSENFRSRPDVRIPRVYWSHTTRRVLTLEDVSAIKITDYAAIEAAGIDRAEVANRLFDAYLKQIFDDHFFHADPHPGNLFVLPDSSVQDESGTVVEAPGASWKLVFVDFGMVGRLQPGQLAGLREIIIAVGTRDAARLVKGYQILGILLPEANLELLEKASSRAFERFWGKTTHEMVGMRHAEAMEFAKEFSELLFDMPFQIPENLILLGRMVGLLSGLCTGLDPNFNLWNSITPYAQKLIAGEGGRGVEFWLKEAVSILTALVSLPRRAESLILRMERGDLELRTTELNEKISHLDHSIRWVAVAILFAALLLGGVQLFMAGYVLLSVILGIGALISLLWLIIKP